MRANNNAVDFVIYQIDNRDTSKNQHRRYDVLLSSVKYSRQRSFYRRRTFLTRYSSLNRAMDCRELFHRLPFFSENFHSAEMETHFAGMR